MLLKFLILVLLAFPSSHLALTLQRISNTTNQRYHLRAISLHERASERQKFWSGTQNLINRLLALEKNVQFVDVGACDGNFQQSNNPVQASLSSDHVQAVLVEPNPVVFDTLKRNLHNKFGESQRIQTIQVALSAKTGKVPFYVVSDRLWKEHPNVPHWMRYQLSSMSKSQVVKHHVAMEPPMTAEQFSKYVNEIHVPSKTPAELLSLVNWAAADVDLLKVDAEGWDAEIVTNFLSTSGFAAKIIIFEAFHLKPNDLSSVMNRLVARGYANSCSQQRCGFNVMAWLPSYFA